MTVRCAQMMKPFYEVRGSAKKPYRVVLFQGRLPSCTCVSYMTRRNKNANYVGGGFPGAGKGLAGQVSAWCKHLAQVEKETCQWELAGTEIPPSRCPRCGGPIVADDGTVVVDTTSVTDGLIAMARDLSGALSRPADPADEPEPEPTTAGATSFDPHQAAAELAAMLKKRN